MKLIQRFCNLHNSRTDRAKVKSTPTNQNTSLKIGQKSDQSCLRESAARAPRATAAPVTRRAGHLSSWLIFDADVAAKRAISRLVHPDVCRSRGKRVVGGRIDGAAKNRRTLPGLPGARSWVILLANNCAERCGHRRPRNRSST